MEPEGVPEGGDRRGSKRVDEAWRRSRARPRACARPAPAPSPGTPVRGAMHGPAASRAIETTRTARVGRSSRPSPCRRPCAASRPTRALGTRWRASCFVREACVRETSRIRATKIPPARKTSTWTSRTSCVAWRRRCAWSLGSHGGTLEMLHDGVCIRVELPWWKKRIERKDRRTTAGPTRTGMEATRRTRRSDRCRACEPCAPEVASKSCDGTWRTPASDTARPCENTTANGRPIHEAPWTWRCSARPCGKPHGVERGMLETCRGVDTKWPPPAAPEVQGTSHVARCRRSCATWNASGGADGRPSCWPCVMRDASAPAARINHRP
eukprot:scaffold2292_cov301-Pavlova_lutheri.AAC.3